MVPSYPGIQISCSYCWWLLALGGTQYSAKQALVFECLSTDPRILHNEHSFAKLVVAFYEFAACIAALTLVWGGVVCSLALPQSSQLSWTEGL